MSKKELRTKIEDLEQRVRILEARPYIWWSYPRYYPSYPVYVPYVEPYKPTWVAPSTITITTASTGTGDTWTSTYNHEL